MEFCTVLLQRGIWFVSFIATVQNEASINEESFSSAELQCMFYPYKHLIPAQCQRPIFAIIRTRLTTLLPNALPVALGRGKSRIWRLTEDAPSPHFNPRGWTESFPRVKLLYTFSLTLIFNCKVCEELNRRSACFSSKLLSFAYAFNYTFIWQKSEEKVRHERSRFGNK